MGGKKGGLKWILHTNNSSEVKDSLLGVSYESNGTGPMPLLKILINCKIFAFLAGPPAKMHT